MRMDILLFLLFYGKDNFKKFIENTSKENKILYVENKSSKLWGRLQSPPLHNQSFDYIILTKKDIVNKISAIKKENKSIKAEEKER